MVDTGSGAAVEPFARLWGSVFTRLVRHMAHLTGSVTRAALAAPLPRCVAQIWSGRQSLSHDRGAPESELSSEDEPTYRGDGRVRPSILTKKKDTDRREVSDGWVFSSFYVFEK